MKKSYLYSLMLVMGAMTSMPQRTSHRSAEPPRSQLPRIKDKVRKINLKNGANEYFFPDGFSCIARGGENANRKHRNWLNARKVTS